MSFTKNKCNNGTIRVCDECGKDVAGKLYGWIRCRHGQFTRDPCGGDICTTCRRKHEEKHAREDAQARAASRA